MTNLVNTNKKPYIYNMKLLITASRKLTDADYPKLAAAIEKHYPTASEILHGGAKGGDQLASRYAQENGLLETVLRPRLPTAPAQGSATAAQRRTGENGRCNAGRICSPKKRRHTGHSDQDAESWQTAGRAEHNHGNDRAARATTDALLKIGLHRKGPAGRDGGAPPTTP